jgi:hypothetical protein
MEIETTKRKVRNNGVYRARTKRRQACGTIWYFSTKSQLKKGLDFSRVVNFCVGFNPTQIFW